jgi:hypothetical protein
MRRMSDQVEVKGDVLVLAGDIGNGVAPHYKNFIWSMAQKFPKVFVVAGNHEYYGNDIDTTNRAISTACQPFENVSFLCSSWEDYKGFRWVGTTLWSRVCQTKYSTNDVRCIQNMSLDRYNQCHTEAVGFLTNILETSLDKQCIVATHYLPSMELIHPKYRTGDDNHYNEWFASPLDHMIGQHTYHVPLWIYGHTHDFSHTRMFETEMVCNPYGYDGEIRNPNLNYTINIEDTTNT